MTEPSGVFAQAPPPPDPAASPAPEQPGATDKDKTTASAKPDVEPAGVHPRHLAYATAGAGTLVSAGALYSVSPWAAGGALAAGVTGIAAHRVLRHRARNTTSAAAARAARRNTRRAARDTGPDRTGPGAPRTPRWPFTRPNAAAASPTGKPAATKPTDPAAKRRWPWSRTPKPPTSPTGPAGGPTPPRRGPKSSRPNTHPGRRDDPKPPRTPTPPKPPTAPRNPKTPQGTTAPPKPPTVKPGPPQPGPSTPPAPTTPKRPWWKLIGRKPTATTPPTATPPPATPRPAASKPAPPTAPSIGAAPAPPKQPKQPWWQPRGTHPPTPPSHTTPPPGPGPGPAPAPPWTPPRWAPPHTSTAPPPDDNIEDAEIVPTPASRTHSPPHTNPLPLPAAPPRSGRRARPVEHFEGAPMSAPTTDASTEATRNDSWTVSENNARASAARFDDEANTHRAQAGLIADKPDMQESYERHQIEATRLEQNADTRRGLARGYAAFRTFVSRGA